jgi:nucleotide-binding universal stress UspA family protein
MPYRHLLVVCDGSAEADEAVTAASDLALADRAKLTVAAVVEFEQSGRGCVAYTSTWNEVLREAAEADLARAAKLVNSPAHYTVLSGPPAKALAEGARELGCDAIMLPSPPRRRIRRLISRDRAALVRRSTNCEVLQPR